MKIPNQEICSWQDVVAAFQRIWGYPDFRSPQGEIVQCLLQQRDSLIIMPTGGGKSICFQLPALLQKGVTLVVSPLVALMENQVQELRQRQLPAASLHSELSSGAKRQVLYDLEQQRLRLLYLSPETLLSQPVWQRLCQPYLVINGLILDEAHCLVQWGESFRPAYYRLGSVRPALLRVRPPGTTMAIAAFTATADPQAQATISRILKLQQPQAFRLNPYRPNLHLSTEMVWTARGRRQRLLCHIQQRSSQAGLVYVRTRRDSEELADWLASWGLATAAYHAGLGSSERRQIEQAWIDDRLQFVVCTCAFGMGINKPNVRWVIHYHLPCLLSEYVQEVGRAGRDGLPAQAISLISEPTGWLDPQDQQRHRFFAEQLAQQQQSARQLATRLPVTGEVEAVCRQFKEAAFALAWLHGSGQLVWLDPFHYRLQLSRSMPSPLAASQPNLMRDYLYGRHCRWQFLLQAFGFSQEAKGFRCGHCDACQR